MHLRCAITQECRGEAMRCRMVTIRCLCVCVLGIARLSSAAGEEPPTASELRGLILEPLRGLRFGSLTLHTTDHFMHRSVTTRHTFKDDCYRVDTYGLEDVTYVSNRDGSKKPIEIDHSTTFVERQAICGDDQHALITQGIDVAHLAATQ